MAVITEYREIKTYDSRTQKYVTIRVDLWIDVDKLAHRLGPKALRNKSKKSHLTEGITAEVRLR